MKVVKFTYKQLKELLGKPSEDATRKWADSRGLQRRNVENSNTKEVLVPYDMFQKIWESAGSPPEFSQPPVEEVPEENTNSVFDDENVVNAEFSDISSYENPGDSYKTAFALSTEFAEEHIRDLAAKQNALLDKNDILYNRITELSRYEERASLLQEELTKRESNIEKFQTKLDYLSEQLRELEAIKIKLELTQELSELKDSELNKLREQLDSLHKNNKELEVQLNVEKTKSIWTRKL